MRSVSNVPLGRTPTSRSGDSRRFTRMRRREIEPLAPIDLAALTRQRVHQRLMREIEAMLLFALRSGIGVPAEVVVELDRALSGSGGGKAANQTRSAPGAATNDAERLGWGRTPIAGEPPTDAEPTSSPTPASAEASDQISLLANVHRELTKLVAPARPGTLVMLRDEEAKYPVRHSFGAVPLVRKMLALASLSLMTMLGVALTQEVNGANMTKGLLGLQGYPLLVNEIFLVAAAAVGATLANLKRLDRYVSACTYDRRYESSYWTRMVMGVISGVILSQLIYGAISGSHTAAAGAGQNAFFDVGQPVLALLGGFSAELVHDVLMHFISVIRNAFGGTEAPSSFPAEPTADTKRDGP